MREPPWKNLVRHLDDSGYESPYLDRLRARQDLRIHREAVGFRRHHDLEQLYPIPPRRA